MSVDPGPTVRRRQLRGELEALRAASGWTLDEVARRTGVAEATASRWHAGRQLPRSNDMKALLDVYGVQGDERDALLQLARDARERSWWQRYPADVLPKWAQGYVALEAGATSVSSWSTGLVHGLLQTEDYCRAILAAAPAAGSPEIIGQKIKLRMQRQERLESAAAPVLWFIIDESAIRRTVGTAAGMRAQLLHIAGMAEQESITVQVLHYGAGAHQGMDGAFSLLSFSEDLVPELAYFEHQTGSFSLEEPADVDRYRATFDHLRALALGPPASVALIREAAAELA